MFLSKMKVLVSGFTVFTIIFVVFALIFSVSCGDESENEEENLTDNDSTEDGDNETPDENGTSEISKEDLAKEACELLKKCDETRYTNFGGEKDCEKNFTQLLLSENPCETYYPDKAFECINALEAGTCDDFVAVLEGTKEVDSCKAMCDAKEIPANISQDDFAVEACKILEECDKEKYNEFSKDSGCVSKFKEVFFSEDLCSIYHSDFAAKCIYQLGGMTCENFLAVLAGTVYVNECVQMCTPAETVNDDDPVTDNEINDDDTL